MIDFDDMEIFDSSIGFDKGKAFSIEISREKLENLEKIRNEIIQNQRLRDRIVDLADLWDGQESQRYGERLQKILDDLGINDIPEFYKKENMNKLIDELIKERND